MVLFLLCIKAELDGVDSLSLLRNVNLCFSVRNPLNDDETRDKVVFNPSETLEQEESEIGNHPITSASNGKGARNTRR